MAFFNDSEMLDELPDFPNSEEAELQANDDDNLFGEAGTDNKDEKLPNENNFLSAKKRTVRNPRQRLTAELLCGERGIQCIEDYFKDIKFKGKGKEKEDLDEIMKRLQHWAHRLYPAYTFDDVIDTIERLGKKRTVQVHMGRYRLGLLERQTETAQLPIENNDGDDERDIENPQTDEPYDEFDALLDQQISISRLETKTPNKVAHHNKYTTPANKPSFIYPSHSRNNISSGGKNTSSTTPSQSSKPSLSAEQKAKMEENKRLALERLKAKKMREQKIEEHKTT